MDGENPTRIRLSFSGALILAGATGVAGGMGAINPTFGKCFPDFIGQWHIMGLPCWEWEPCGRQHVMGADEVSQAMPQAMGASGTVNRATTPSMATVRRIGERLSRRVARRPLLHMSRSTVI